MNLNWINNFSSSNVDSFAWDENDPTHKFHIRFKDRKGNITGHYKANCDLDKYNGMDQADSKGQYWNAYIRNAYDVVPVD